MDGAGAPVRARRRVMAIGALPLEVGSSWGSMPHPSRSQCTTDRKSTRLNSSPTKISTLSLHDALPIYARVDAPRVGVALPRVPFEPECLRQPGLDGRSRGPRARETSGVGHRGTSSRGGQFLGVDAALVEGPVHP